MGRGSASHANNPSQEPEERGHQPLPEQSANTPASQPPDESPHPATSPAAASRSGDDERRRGWFWHWNGIVTQYTPLIGLKGIGLLNSYTVWTDRREDSPHRGYAFPSQQSEANFYGEDRAELIAINKILVALDLIEIRKEMVRKIDEQGRRWKVPQNFYRVKDRQNGLDLTTADVIRVIEMAERDKAVYRYIRKLFSSKFEPIDRDNVWRGILIEIAEHPTWQKLAERAAKQEARASARTKAGHRSRARQDQDEDTLNNEADDETAGTTGTTPSTKPAEPPVSGTTVEADQPDNHATVMTSGQDDDKSSSNTEHHDTNGGNTKTSVDDASNGSATDVARTNRASGVADDTTSNGSKGLERGNVADANNGHASSVEPGNTMYYESSSTTTTTTSGLEDSAREAPITGGGIDATRPDQQGGNGDEEKSAARPPHDYIDLDSETTDSTDGAIDTGAAGQGGESPKRDLADERAGGPLGDPSALVVSLYEAANDRPPTRLERILLSELEADAAGPARAAGTTGSDWVAAALREAVGSGSAFVAPKRIREIVNRWASSGSGPRGSVVDNLDATGAAPNRQAAANEELDVMLIKQTLDDMLDRDLRVEVRDGVVLLAPEDGAPVAEHRDIEAIERRLSSAAGRDIRVQIQYPAAAADRSRGSYAEELVQVSRGDVQQGEQLWSVLLDMLAPEAAPSDLYRLRSVVPIGESADGAFLLGASTRLAARLLEGRYSGPVESALSSLLASPVRILVLSQDQWSVAD